MNKQLRLYEQGMTMAEQGNLRGACNKLIAAVLAAPSVWSSVRFNPFMSYCIILRELHFKASPSDISTLKEKFLENDKEPPHFRVQSAFTLGVLYSNSCKREQAADAYREGLGIARAATAEEKARTVECHDGTHSVGYFVESITQNIESNLSIMSGHGRTIPYDPSVQRRDFGSKDAMPNIGPDISISFQEGGNQADVEEIANAMERATIVGGNVCDNCGKTLKELGVPRFLCCARCELSYYCSKACQKTAWRSGHKEACRSKNQIVIGDFMMLVGLVKKPEMNGTVGRIKGPAEKKDRWMIDISGKKDALSIPASNLQHIRPAK